MSLKQFRELLEKENDDVVFNVKIKLLKDLIDKINELEERVDRIGERINWND